jgi:hypothetical protein
MFRAMTRHKGAKKHSYPIPAHWLPHDGTGCPVDLASGPGVAMRGGDQTVVNGMPAITWHRYSEGSCWEWADREPRDSDIIAYCPGNRMLPEPLKCRGILDDGTPCDLHRGHRGPHDAMVAVPRLSYDQGEGVPLPHDQRNGV